MAAKVKIGILGYGNLGKATELAIKNNDDMELVSTFTRRNPSEIKTLTNSTVASVNEISNYKDKIDVLVFYVVARQQIYLNKPQNLPNHSMS